MESAPKRSIFLRAGKKIRKKKTLVRYGFADSLPGLNARKTDSKQIIRSALSDRSTERSLRYEIRRQGIQKKSRDYEQGADADRLPHQQADGALSPPIQPIPHTCTGKKTRCYAIKKSDVIAFMNDREVNPEKYIAPKNWYKYGSEMVRPYKIRIHPPCAKDEKKLRRYYESKLAALPDVMDVAAAVDFTGYNRRTVCQWIRVGKLKALALLQKYMIPKCYLIDWLCSDDYNNTNRKSRRHIDMLWEVQKWRD